MMSDIMGRFRAVAFLEGCSYLLLFITMPLKYWLAMPKPNYFVGLVHGLLFILYVILLINVAFEYKWSFRKIVLAFLASLLPFGTFIADRKLYRSEMV